METSQGIRLVDENDGDKAAAVNDALRDVDGLVTELKEQQTFVQAYDIAGSGSGKPSAGAVVVEFLAPRVFSFAAAMAPSRAKARTAATALSTFSLRKNNVEFGEVRFVAGATSGQFEAATKTDFVAGDLLTLVAPASPDATLADLVFTLAGVLP